MNKISKSWIALGVILFGAFIGSSLYAANFTTNVNWCTTNSGTINVSYQECVGLAYLYEETSGDNWLRNANWFSNTDLSTWSGGSNRGVTSGALKISGGHVEDLHLWNNSLSGTITTGLIYLPYLKFLDLSLNTIRSINLSQNTGLTFLNIGSNSLLSVDVTMLTGLKQLFIGGGQISGINLSHNINLTGLTIYGTPITYINLSANTGLITLSLDLNALTGLDVSKQPNMTFLSASYQSGKSMRYINLSGATSLYGLYLADNGLTGINLLPVGGTLSQVRLDGNNLTEISVTGNTSLGYLNLIGNNISTLDLSNNYYMGALFLGSGNTGLTYIDISANTGLLTLSMSGIAITGFKIATTTNYRSDLMVDFKGHALNPASLSLAQLWFLNQHFSDRGYLGIPGPGATYSLGGGGGGGGGGGSVSNLPALQTTGQVATGTMTTGNVTTGTTITGSTAPSMPVIVTDTDVHAWALSHNITTLPLAKVRLQDEILRYEAAKMIVNFAVNVKQTTIVHNPTCNIEKYGDIMSFDAEMKEYITNICDLGLMGWKGDKKNILENFRPFDTLSAEEFGIVIGRYIGASASNPKTSKRVDIMRFLFEQSTEN